MKKHARILVSAIAASALTLAGCSNTEQDSAQSDTAPESASSDTNNADAEDNDDVLEFENGVVRAMDENADMTAIFGSLVNESTEDVEVVGFTSSVDAGVNEIHETVDGQMQQMEEPLVIPAGESVTLEPGGAHFMLMEVSSPVMAGEEITVTVELANGLNKEFDDIPVRTIGAGDENYGDLGHDEHSEHDDHDEHDD